MTGIELYSTTAASNNSSPPNGWPEGMAPSAVNDAARQMMAAIRTWYESAEWVNLGYTHVYVASTQFKVAGTDVTSHYSVGRRVKVVAATPGTIYGKITASSFSTDTTITVSFDSGSLSNETLTSISVGAIKGGSSAQSIDYTGVKGAAQAVITTRGDVIRGSSAGVAERLALGTIAQALISNGTDATFGYPANRFYFNTFTRDVTTASGTQAVTGVGFQPRWAIFFANINGGIEVSWGFDTASDQGSIAQAHGEVANTFVTSTSFSISLRTNGTTLYQGELASFDADGFTVNWTKTGSPTGTARMFYIVG